MWIGDDKNRTSGQYQFRNQVEIHAESNDNFKLFRWNDNNRETARTITVGDTDVAYRASFISANMIPGLFIVSSSNKQVFFTNDSSDPTKPNSSFTVSGQKGVWRVLSGANNGEWKYLLDSRKTTYGSGVLSISNRRYATVKVNDMAGLLIFPDDFSSWPSGAGNEPQTFNTNSSNWNDRNYTVAEFTVLQNAGAVCLPAAGYRDGAEGTAYVYSVGWHGSYWSSTFGVYKDAYRLYFNPDYIYPANVINWHYAYAVRLVTECE